MEIIEVIKEYVVEILLLINVGSIVALIKALSEARSRANKDKIESQTSKVQIEEMKLDIQASILEHAREQLHEEFIANEQLRDRIREAEGGIKALEGSYGGKVHELEKKITNLDNQISLLTIKLEARENRIEQLEAREVAQGKVVEALKEENRRLRERNRQLEKRVRELEKKIEELQKHRSQ